MSSLWPQSKREVYFNDPDGAERVKRSEEAFGRPPSFGKSDILGVRFSLALASGSSASMARAMSLLPDAFDHDHDHEHHQLLTMDDSTPPPPPAAPTEPSPPPPPSSSGSPTDFLKGVVGKRVVVRLTSGVDYRGKCMVF
ncbi:hypothetical protein NUW54_g3134 [Trametes sanguinea]|uniref:Uncharacterized protein n=1 Tax=Trametes sanguinea TaxID=158606 RepID=A0ACC1Q1L4_9APHY|nr:hypothetical protein NUW54_g3134 [Trametes sanguinea]